MDAFRALVIQKEDDRMVTEIRDIEAEDLPEGDVLVDVRYASLNYKDGLVLNGLGGLVKKYPHVPGIDYAGTVTHSLHPNFKRGDRVIGTGFRVGEVRWGGYAQRVSTRSEWLVSLPNSLTLHQAMSLGSAGLTAAIALRALEEHGVHANQGEVLVTGASGGVGSVAVSLLTHLGYQVVALTGREENADYLRHLGAKEVLPRTQLSSTSEKPLESARWAACIDSVGGPVLSRLLAQIQPGGSVAAVGLAGGAALETSVIPFLLRGINLLGIDSVFHPNERRSKAWNRLADRIPKDALSHITTDIGLSDLPVWGQSILAGQVRGRVVVDIHR